MGKQISRIRRRANHRKKNRRMQIIRINNTLKVPSFETFQIKKQEETKRKRTYLKTQQFSSYFNLSMRKLFYYYLRRPFMGFVFVSNTGRAGLPSRAAFYLEPGCPNQGRPEECLEKLIFSLPIPKNQLSNHKSTTENIEDTRNRRTRRRHSRNERRTTRRDAGSVLRRGTIVVGGGWPRQA